MHRPWIAIACCLFAVHAKAGVFSNDFAVVFADATTEARYGALPFDRALLARSIEMAARAGARGVIVKFFLDQPRAPDSDRELAEAMTLLPVVLQARLDDATENSNPLPSRFVLRGGPFASAISANNGWMPIPSFSERAHDVGFVDFDSAEVPLVERYRGLPVKSLLLCAMELAAGTSAKIVSSREVSFGSQAMPLDSLNRVTALMSNRSPLDELKLHELLDGTVPASALKGKVVILAYDGPNIPASNTEFGRVGAHRFFILLLRAVYQASTQ